PFIQQPLNAGDDLPDDLVIIRLQILAFGLGPSGEEEDRPVGGQEGVEDTIPATLTLPRGRVGGANLPGTAPAPDDRRSRGMARDLILQGPEFVFSQPQIGPVFGERTNFDEVIVLGTAIPSWIGRSIGPLSRHRG